MSMVLSVLLAVVCIALLATVVYAINGLVLLWRLSMKFTDSLDRYWYRGE